MYVFATPQQIARGLFLVRRNVNRRQRAGPIENGQLPRVPTVRLHAIPCTAGDQGRRDHVARHLVPGQGALELKAAGPGFITTAHRTLTTDTRDEADDG